EHLHEIAAGGLAWGARGIPHAFANRAKDPLRIMIMWIPGGAEGLFQELAEYLQSVDGAPDQQVVAEIQARYGCTHVRPQIPSPALSRVHFAAGRRLLGSQATDRQLFSYGRSALVASALQQLGRTEWAISRPGAGARCAAGGGRRCAPQSCAPA